MSDIEELYRAVFAAPADDGPRLVLADALQERGDPRGEFISLQLQNPRAQRSERRMQKLLERHRTEFLRGLASAVMPDATQQWERGFLSEASVVLSGDRVDTPDWATLKKLEVLFSGAPPLELASEHMRSLKEITLAPLEAVPVLFAAPKPLRVEAVTLQGPPELGAWPDMEVAMISEAASLPSLQRLVLRCQTPNFTEADWVWKMPLLERVRSLEFQLLFRALPLPALLIRAREADVPPFAVVLHVSGAKLRFKRDDGYRSMVAELDGANGVHMLEAMFKVIPVDLFDELLVTSAQPLETAQLALLKRAVKRLQLRNLSLPVR